MLVLWLGEPLQSGACLIHPLGGAVDAANWPRSLGPCRTGATAPALAPAFNWKEDRPPSTSCRVGGGPSRVEIQPDRRWGSPQGRSGAAETAACRRTACHSVRRGGGRWRDSLWPIFTTFAVRLPVEALQTEPNWLADLPAGRSAGQPAYGQRPGAVRYFDLAGSPSTDASQPVDRRVEPTPYADQIDDPELQTVRRS